MTEEKTLAEKLLDEAGASEMSKEEADEAFDQIREDEGMELAEPTRKPPIGVDVVQVMRHPEFWTFIMNAAYRTNEGTDKDPEWGYKMMVPTWEELPPGQPIPQYAALPLQEHAVQRLFDEMWNQGFRPSGTKVVLETSPDHGLLAELRALRAEVMATREKEVDPSTEDE